MSLKAFHIFFISLAIITSFFFGTWLFITVEVGDPFHRFLSGGISYAVGLALVLYGRYFLHKFRHVSFM